MIGKTLDRLELILEKQSQYHCGVIEMEVMPDHVHLLLDANPKDDIAGIVDMIKVYTSFAFREFGVFRKPLWSTSKFISSVGAVTLECC